MGKIGVSANGIFNFDFFSLLDTIKFFHFMTGDGQNSAEFCPMVHPVRDNPCPISAMKKLYCAQGRSL